MRSNVQTISFEYDLSHKTLKECGCFRSRHREAFRRPANRTIIEIAGFTPTSGSNYSKEILEEPWISPVDDLIAILKYWEPDFCEFLSRAYARTDGPKIDLLPALNGRKSAPMGMTPLLPITEKRKRIVWERIRSSERHLKRRQVTFLVTELHRHRLMNDLV